jgi:hypothetical protein
VEKEAKVKAAKESELVKMVRAGEDEERSGEGVGLLEADEVSKRTNERTNDGANRALP